MLFMQWPDEADPAPSPEFHKAVKLADSSCLMPLSKSDVALPAGLGRKKISFIRNILSAPKDRESWGKN